MNIKESIATMLDQIATGDQESAAETFQQIIGEKIGSRLEDMKVDAAATMFGDKVNEAYEDTAAGAAGGLSTGAAGGGNVPTPAPHTHHIVVTPPAGGRGKESVFHPDQVHHAAALVKAIPGSKMTTRAGPMP